MTIEAVALFVHFKLLRGLPLSEKEQEVGKKVFDDVHFDIIIASMLTNAIVYSTFGGTSVKLEGGGPEPDPRCELEGIDCDSGYTFLGSIGMIMDIFLLISLISIVLEDILLT